MAAAQLPAEGQGIRGHHQIEIGLAAQPVQQGIPHGPHPGTTVKSFEHTRTEELAVMFDTAQPLELTAAALTMDDPAYPLGWLD